MIALLLALSLNPAPTPTLPNAPAPVSEQGPPAAIDIGDKQVAQLQAMFDQSCAQRAYATYDDLCEALKDQIKSAQRTADRARRSVPTPPTHR
jgi:hypothetical protein